jgi:hypothetical protein
MASSPVRRQPSSITTGAALELAADDEDEDVSDASDASNTTIPDKDVVGTNSDVNTNVANNNVTSDIADVNKNATDELDAEAAVANADVAPLPNELGSRKGSHAPPTGLSVSPARSEEAINTFGRSPARSSAGVSPWCALHSSLLAFRKLALPLLCNRLARLRGVN